MHTLKINSILCSKCLLCHARVPYLLLSFTDGKLMISDYFWQVHGHNINSAIKCCEPGALTLEKEDETDTDYPAS